MKKKRGIMVSLLGVFMFLLGLYFVKNAQSIGVMKTIPYLLIGIGCGTFGHGVGEFFGKLAMEKDPKLAKQMEINQKDERNLMLSNMSKAKGYDIMSFVIPALMLAYVLMGASMEIIIPLVASYLFIQFYTIYILSKKSKEN